MKLSELFKTKDQWTQHEYAKTKEGGPIDPNHEKAVCWCLIGGIMKCFGEGAGCVISEFKRLAFRRGFLNIVHFNDSSSFEEIKAVIEEFEDAANTQKTEQI